MRGRRIDLVVPATFLRGMRYSGYPSTAHAIQELVDNSIEADSRNVHVVFGFTDSAAKPSALAVLDDGHGMEPGMLRMALAWGGTHREDSRAGFGRFGYGLPTASISQGNRFTVYSRTTSTQFHRGSIDVDEVSPLGEPSESTRPRRSRLPEWIEEYASKFLPDLTRFSGHGTAVVLEKLHGVSWKTGVALERNLVRTLGITYRTPAWRVRLHVQGRRVQPIDPLFLTKSGKYFDLDDERAIPIPFPAIKIAGARGPALVRVRAAYFPPTFARVDKSRDAVGLNANARFPIMKENIGLIVTRLGRQVDVVASGLWTQFQNNDRYWAIEIDFPPELDEWFAITTNKQRVTLTETAREALRKGGIPELIEALRLRHARDKRELSAGGQDPIPDPAAPVAAEAWPVTSVVGGTFYFPRPDGGFALNDQHPFFGAVHGTPPGRDGERRVLAALISALANSEAGADSDTKRFYRRERRRWSEQLMQRPTE